MEWLYEKSPTQGGGPELLKTVIEEARARMAGDAEEGAVEGGQTKKVSRGASIMLERTIRWLEGYRDGKEQGIRDEQKKG